MDLSFAEILAIMVAVIILFGPKRIPEIARGLGEGVRTLRNATDEIKREIMKEADDIKSTADISDEINSFKKKINDPLDISEEKISNIEDNEGPIKR